ncbi:chromosome partitioning protein ParA [Spirochaetia bacterium]|nr:chromosome partitioning protein ParA [Spirochaetia bacterium]
MAKIITTASWKGGTGKTTLNTALIRLLAEGGKKVLIIDLDSNCAISQVFGQILKDITSMEFLSAGIDNFKGVYPCAENIDIIPGNIKNVLLNNISDVQLKINLKRSGLGEKYDYIIIDPPGYLGAHTRNALFAADVLIIPGTCSRIDFEATRLFFEEVQQYGLDADTYICINAFNAKTNLPGICEMYQETFGEFLIPDPVPYISSLKKLTNDFRYPLHASVRKRLENYVNYVIGGKNA